jgi:hypothetical protein
MRTLAVAVLGGAVLLAGQTSISQAQMGSGGQGASGDQPGSSMTAPGPGQAQNQPKSSMEKQAVDMTGGKSGIPEHYDVVPVRRGELKDEHGGMLDQEVTNAQGEKLGTIEKLLKDTKTGKIEYAVLELADTKYQLPMQWSLFKQQGGKLTLKASKKDLQPNVNSTLTKDMSPEISQYMNEINKVRQQPKTGGGIGIEQQPASAGSMGEDTVGGGGPAGTRALPPQDRAPGFEGGDPSSKR